MFGKTEKDVVRSMFEGFADLVAIVIWPTTRRVCEQTYTRWEMSFFKRGQESIIPEGRGVVYNREDFLPD